MSANINDNNSIYVTDWSPFEEAKYRARFHFDPNSIAMGNLDAHNLFYATNRDNQTVLMIDIRQNYGDYQVRAQTIDDSSSWSPSIWGSITDGPHSLEVNWQAATSAGANNGVFTFWVDGTQIATWTNLDNDTRRIDWAQLGAVYGVDTNTRGVEYFDCFVSKRDSYIGPDPSAPEPPDWPEKTDALFADGFESGDFSAWTSAVTDSGSLSVTGGAALIGSYGMSANINDNNAIYVNDWLPFEEATYRARFYFDPNSITMTGTDRHYIFVASDRNSAAVTRIEFYRISGVYQVRAEAIRDAGTWTTGGWRTISDEPHYLEVSWWASSEAGANDGGLTFWVDGAQQDTYSTIDNDTKRIEYVQLGPSSGIDTGTRGTLYFDAFESKRTSYIGPVAGLLSEWRMVRIPGWEEVWDWAISLFETDSVAVAYEPANEDESAPTLAAWDSWLGVGRTLAAPVIAPREVGHAVTSSRTITYTYDNLYRLTGASYNDGTYFPYTYDATVNRLTEVTNSGSTSYVYDNANRLTSVGGVSYTWDDNGNLLYDGVSTYTYNHANRLASLAQGGVTTTYTYNGQGDRVRQTIGEAPTTYALDIAGGLTQVLSDGSQAYLYGVSRIGEEQSEGWMYHLPDALGSVRQLVDGSGVVALERAYRPFGEVLNSLGTGLSIYAFAGEQRDASGLVYLRARYYALYPIPTSTHGRRSTDPQER